MSKDMFVFHSLLGEGGFGKVVSAMMVHNKRWFAVKCINKYNLLQHKTGAEMLFGELKALSRLDHPFLTGLKIAFHDKKSCYLIMDLKAGGDLRFYLRKKVLFEEKDIAFIMACLSSALEYIHSKNVIHRDVKPENIIFDEKGFPHLADFGVAYVHESKGNDLALCCTLASGTKQYLAPEVFTKAHVHGPECDYWSLGVVAYELLFGRRPFDKHCPSPMIHYLEGAFQQRQYNQIHFNEPLTVHMCCCHHENHQDFSNSTSPTSPNNSTKSSLTSAAISTVSNSSIILGSSQQTNKCAIPNRGSLNRSCDNSAVSNIALTTIEQQSVDSVALSPKKTTSTRSKLASHSENGSSECKMESGRQSNVLPKTQASRIVTPFSLLSEMDDETKDERDFPGEIGPHYFVGDHWCVSYDNLDDTLRVSIPHFTVWLGNLSPSCISFLEGLFEVRPSHRLGCRNFGDIIQHPWFSENGIVDVSRLSCKNSTPFFVPGDRYMNEACNNIDALVDQIIGEDASNEIAITSQQEQLFRNFEFVAPEYQEFCFVHNIVKPPMNRPKDDLPNIERVENISLFSRKSDTEIGESKSISSQFLKRSHQYIRGSGISLNISKTPHGGSSNTVHPQNFPKNDSTGYCINNVNSQGSNNNSARIIESQLLPSMASPSKHNNSGLFTKLWHEERPTTSIAQQSTRKSNNIISSLAPTSSTMKWFASKSEGNAKQSPGQLQLQGQRHSPSKRFPRLQH